MKKNYLIGGPVTFFVFGIFSILFSSCYFKNDKKSSTDMEFVKDSAARMMANIAGNLSVKGPIAWLDYFEDSPDFFMASEGELAFKDYPSAKIFIENTLVKNIRRIELQWDHLRIDPLTTSLASVGAGFHEDLTDSAGKRVQEQGYFTGIAEHTTRGWQLRNAHWSLLNHKGGN